MLFVCYGIRLEIMLPQSWKALLLCLRAPGDAFENSDATPSFVCELLFSLETALFIAYVLKCF